MDRAQTLLRIKAVIANIKDPSERVASALVLLHEFAEEVRADIKTPDLQSRLDTTVAQRDEAIAAADGAMVRNLELQGDVADLKDRLAAAVKLSGAHRTDGVRLQAEVDNLMDRLAHAMAERASAHRVCDEQHATLKARQAENDTLKAELSHATTARDRRIVAGQVQAVQVPDTPRATIDTLDAQLKMLAGRFNLHCKAVNEALVDLRREPQAARETAAAQADRIGKLEYAGRCHAERIVKLESVRDLQAARLDAVMGRLDGLEHNGEVNRQRIDGHDRTMTLHFGQFDTAVRESPRGRVAD